MLSEQSTVAEMKEFAAKVGTVIPKEITRKPDILEFLKNPKPKDPAAAALAAHKAKEQAERDLQAKTQEDNFKKEIKKPLNERGKAYLAELEAMARSGKIPDTDQMKDLRLLRERVKVTPLSVIEQNELAELEVKRQNPEATKIPASGVTEAERFDDLGKRSQLNED